MIFCNSLILEGAFLKEKLKHLWSALSITLYHKSRCLGFVCTYLITCSSPDCLLISFHAYLSLLIFTVCLSLCISFATLHKHGKISCIEKSKPKYIINWSDFLTVVFLLVVRLSFLPAVLSGSTKLVSVAFDSVGQSLILTIAPRNTFLINLKTGILYSFALWAMFSEASGAVFLKSSHPHLTLASIFYFLCFPNLFLIDYLEELPPSSLPCTVPSIWPSLFCLQYVCRWLTPQIQF